MNKQSWLAVTLVAAIVGLVPAVYADSISPAIRDKGKVYSKEAPDTSYYGTGIGGRAMEASVLRMDAERYLQDARYDEALRRTKKAVQLAPADVEGHYLLARVLTRKIEATDGPIDEKMLRDAIYEWRALWLHDADYSEQLEAKYNTLRLMRIAHGIAKQKKIEAKAREKAKAALAMQREQDAKSAAATVVPPAKELSAEKPLSADKTSDEDSENAPAAVQGTAQPASAKAATAAPSEDRADKQIASKKKHFFLF